MKRDGTFDSGSCNRRDLLQATAAALTALPLAGVSSALAAAPAKTPTKSPARPAITEPLRRFPRIVQDYFVRRVREAQDEADRVRAALRTKADAEAYVRNVQNKIQTAFGPWPEKTPLNARVTGIIQRDAYQIEKVIFESRPGFLVTGNLYVPKGRKFPLPGVVGTCGHSSNGKASDAYQSFAQGLARMGYVVLIFDPIGQGERSQYLTEKSKPGNGMAVREHMLCGNQQYLVGEFFGTWRAWDGIRALDYLLSRPEVDPRHVGVTGNSGGGTMTTWLCGVEQRWTMGAPSCFVTTFRRNMENELPADTEQCPPRALALGLDHSDFLAAMAPKPVIILAKEKDYFDVRGSIEAYERLKRLYTLLGKPDNIGLFYGPTHHGYSQENREAMYRWFNRTTGISQATTEPELTIEKDETLWCTPNGQVGPMKSPTVFSFTQAASRQLAGRRKPLAAGELAGSIQQLLRLPARPRQFDFRILRPIGGRGYPKKHCLSYVLPTEPDVFALMHLLLDEPHYSRPPQGANRAVLYVAHHSSDAELREEPLVAEVLKREKEAFFWACDVRGIGDSRPNTCGRDTFLDPYGSDYFYSSHAFMLDYPYLGQKTFDLLCALDWLSELGQRQVHLVGKGWGALPATFAAILHPAVVQVTLKNALTSYAAVAESEEYSWPLSALLPGVLKEFDLPDCYAALKAKQLRQVEPWDARAK